MNLRDDELQFIKDNHSAAMITVALDGTAKVARVGVTVVGDRLWSSGTQDRVRTRRLRQDPRCTLFVFESGFAWLALETTVRILDGSDTAEQSVRLFREMQGRPSGPLSWFGNDLDERAFRQAMLDEGRVIYEFEVQRSYGLH